jgi:predicted ATPase/class 3 adenylate cyclase
MVGLPSGTVTFLLTDIEGSTQLWEKHPEAMRQALARHDSILAAAVGGCGGQIVKNRGEGDSVFAVFARASDGAAAACAAQVALSAEPWPSPVTVRVRMALHTGEAELREGDYFGGAISRCARIRAVGHGGQTLLSGATAELGRDSLPEGASLRLLGMHRLRDLASAEALWQLAHPSLPAEFPPLRSFSTMPNNLPTQLSRFIGREKELGEIRQLLQQSRLVTLTGSGGCGKTRLAIEAGADLLEEFPGGVWVAELANLTDPALVAKGVASALGMDEESGRAIAASLADYLRPKKLLLILDNCEHLVGACAQLAESLLRASPDLKILATSREPLAIAGETTYRVPSLSVPNLRQLPPPDQLTMYEAVRLFIDRAAAAQPGFSVTAANAPAIAEICHRLDGIPLAVELAAARVKVLTPDQIATRLSDRFRLLTAGSRTALPRQQTLRAAVAWSYDLLSEREQLLWQRLSAFAGGCTLEAAESVCADDLLAQYEVLDLLSQLVDKSLVLAEEQDGELRYRLTETLRQFGSEKLTESGREQEFRRRHRDWCLHWLEEADRQLDGPDQVAWFRKIDRELENLRAALEWTQAEAGSDVTLLRLSRAAAVYWHSFSHFAEGRRWLETALAAAPDAPAELRAQSLERLNNILSMAGATTEEQAAPMREAATLYESLGSRAGHASALRARAEVAALHFQIAEATRLLEEALALFREEGDSLNVGAVLARLGYYAAMQPGDSRDKSMQYLEEALAVFRRLQHRRMLSVVANSLGAAHLWRGELERAVALFEQRLAFDRQLGRRLGVAAALVNIAFSEMLRGNLERAAALSQEGLDLGRGFGSRYFTAVGETLAAYIALARGDAGQALALLRPNVSWFTESGAAPMAGFGLLGAGVALVRLGDPAGGARLIAGGVRAWTSAGVETFRPMAPLLQGAFEEAKRELGEQAFDAAVREGEQAPVQKLVRYAAGEEPW